MARRALSLLLVSVAVSCTVRPRDRVVRAGDVGDPARTRITAFLSAPRRPGQPTEKPWGEIPREAVVDEASLAKLDDQRTCVQLVERTHAGLDKPLTAWKLALSGAPATIEGETVSVHDWSKAGVRTTIAAGLTAEDAKRYETEAVPEGTFRVFERAALVCGPPASGKVRLELELPTDDMHGPWGQVFDWKIK